MMQAADLWNRHGLLHLKWIDLAAFLLAKISMLRYSVVVISWI